MPRQAIWGSALLISAICVVAIACAQDGNWQPPAGQPRSAVGNEPAYLPTETQIDATPVAMQVDDPPPPTDPQAAVFGRGLPRTSAALPATDEPRPFPMTNRAEGAPPVSPAPETWQQPGGALPQRSVLRRPGQPLPQAIPNETQSISDEEATTATPRSILKRPVGPVVGDVAAPVAPVLAAPPAAEIPNDSSRRMYDPAATSSPTTTSRLPGPGRTTPSQSQDLVISSQGPRLRVELAGPQALMVGKSGRYVINLVNEGDAPADDVQLRLNLPPWITVQAGETTTGEAAAAQADASGATRMVWSLPKVKANSQETLRLQVVATEGQPFEITADWTCKPASLKAAVAVRQPQLELTLAGPSDMIFGEEKPFTITVSNPGNGDAEQVVVQLIVGSNAPQSVEVGIVPAGQSKDVNVKVSANQPNSMDLKLSATADGNLRAEAAGKIVVKQAILAITVDGPPLKFAGADAVYAVTVSNTGNAAADDLTVSATLPTGGKYLGGIEGATFAGSVLKWKAGLLPPETERTYEIRCQLNAAGAHRVVVQAHGPRTGAASHEVETTVEAVSNLKLAVNDPSGPSPVGQEVTYEVQLMNRGTLAAKNVKLVMQFSEGLEPASVAGAEGRVVPGQVLFEALPELGAGEQVVVHVKAKAGKEGSHRFRVEVVSTDNDTRLVSEGTTRFFTDARSLSNSPAARTATRPKLVPTPIQNLQR